MAMLRSKLRARDIVTRKSIENAVTVVFALGGSTNAVLHLLAIAHEAQVDFSIHDFGDVGARVPLIGNLSPHGKYVQQMYTPKGTLAIENSSITN